MTIASDIKKLCTPAYVYLVISVISVVLLMIQNAGNDTRYCVGNFECNVPSTAMLFVGKALYVIFWTFILNALCNAGYSGISWFLILLPFLLFFIIIGMIMLGQGVSS